MIGKVDGATAAAYVAQYVRVNGITQASYPQNSGSPSEPSQIGGSAVNGGVALEMIEKIEATQANGGWPPIGSVIDIKA